MKHILRMPFQLNLADILPSRKTLFKQIMIFHRFCLLYFDKIYPLTQLHRKWISKILVLLYFNNSLFILFQELNPLCIEKIDQIADGICDGDLNIGGACRFDGGDCCKFLIDDSRCSGENCICNEDNLLHFSLKE